MNTKFVGAIIIAFLLGAAVPVTYLWVAKPEAEQATEDRQLWTCGMHPHVLEHEPGNCPICGMKLTPVNAETEAQPPIEIEGAEAQTAGAAPAVRVSQGFLQNFAVRTVAADRGSIPVEIQTVGQLGYDERRIVSVNTKYGGWIEKARVNYVGENVKAGDLLFEVYSPELVTTQKE
ncbi:MAG: efflux RND transporter periplasmic adaptor subunit, partial [bacterium]|nr:efflux RND transporter periplasmic adaptor subunit [bacterium]